MKDGSKIRLDGASIYQGEELIADGIEQTPESVADLLIEAKAGMSAQLEAFAANAIEYMKRERTLLLDGVGIPDISTRIAGRQVLIVAASADTKAELKAIKKYISDYHPVLVGVDGGADALRAAGYKPQLIIGNPEEIGPDTLRGGAEVVIPADIDGHAPGLGTAAGSRPRCGDVPGHRYHRGPGAAAGGCARRQPDRHRRHAHHPDRPARSQGRRGLDLPGPDAGGQQDRRGACRRPALQGPHRLVGGDAAGRSPHVAAIVGALLVSDVSHTYIDLARQWWNDFVNWVKGLF